MTRHDLADYIAVDAAGSDQPRRRRRRHPDCSARSTPCASGSIRTSSTSYQLTPRDVDRRDPGAERPGLRRRSSAACRRSPGQQLNATDHRAEPAADAGAVRRDPAATSTRTARSVRLRDVARVELGSESYNVDARYNGKPAAGMAIRLAPGANALDTADAVQARRSRELAESFPPGVKVVYPYDTTPFVRALDRGGRQDADRGDRARLPRDVPVPAELARHAHPDDRRAGRAARHVRRPGGRRLFASTR